LQRPREKSAVNWKDLIPIDAQGRGLARKIGAKLALGSEIDGEKEILAPLRAQLDNAQWELKQTIMRAPVG
jgi:multidrug resistance efflux pump